MSRPGSRQWWGETALIAAGGFALAAWLWDGVPESFRQLILTEETAPVEALRDEPRTLAELMESGCISGDNLSDMREGRQTRIICPIVGPPPTLRDLPPNERPFP